MAEKKTTKKTEGAKLSKKEEIRLEMDKRLAELLEIAKKNNNELTYLQINQAFTGMKLRDAQFDYILEFFEKNQITMNKTEVPEGMDLDADLDVDDDGFIPSEEDEIDTSDLDLSVPEGISVEDPVRMYLKEIISLI